MTRQELSRWLGWLAVAALAAHIYLSMTDGS